VRWSEEQENYLYTQWVTCGTNLTWSQYQDWAEAEVAKKATRAAQRAEALRVAEWRLEQQRLAEREAKIRREQEKERKRRKEEYKAKCEAQRDAWERGVALEPAPPKGGGPWHSEGQWFEGHGDVTDEVNDTLDVLGLRLASHGPEPDAEDDNPGFAAGRRMDYFFRDTLNDTLTGISPHLIALRSRPLARVPSGIIPRIESGNRLH
jgi:hypothetical protein